MNYRIKALGLSCVTVLLLTACVMPMYTDHGTHMDHNMDHNMDHSPRADVAAPFDAQFIDGMIVHHQGAIDMAEQVLAQSERPELLTMAEQIISAQQVEIDQMQAWRAAWYPDVAVSVDSTMEMGDMQISEDATLPFDQRFLVVMISHHQGALNMATSAFANAAHSEIKTLASAIIAAQEAEIAQMTQWLQAWFGVEAASPSSLVSPYTTQLESAVRGLSQQEVDDLLAGHGMGFARMAELNNYPGPRHLLDLQQEMALSAEQVQQIEQIFAAMQTHAQELGQQVVAAEAQLSAAFAAGTITEAELAAQVEALAGLYGDLRAVHLQAHLQVTLLLSDAQRMRYNELRGYRMHDHRHP